MINKSYKSLILRSFILLIAAPLSADGPRTAATTEWTAAFCRAAGITDVVVLAPSGLIHPPDYELRPSDIPALINAELIVYGGYEIMAERIHSHVAGTGTKLLRIETSYDTTILKKSINRIAMEAGTTPGGLERIKKAWEEARYMLLEADIAGKGVIAHQFQVPFAKEAGFIIKGVFGPMPPGPKLIAESSSISASFVLDNAHNPIGSPIVEVLKDAALVQLINFPGQHGTRELADVILHNAKALIESAQ